MFAAAYLSASSIIFSANSSLKNNLKRYISCVDGCNNYEGESIILFDVRVFFATLPADNKTGRVWPVVAWTSTNTVKCAKFEWDETVNKNS